MIITIDAALKLEGEDTGEVAEGIGAAIGGPGIERYKINLIDDLEFSSRARWPLDKDASFLKGAGIKLWIKYFYY